MQPIECGDEANVIAPEKRAAKGRLKASREVRAEPAERLVR